MAQRGIIRSSSSEYTSPIVMVKERGSSRMCSDYRRGEQKLKDKFPLPLIEDVLTLARSKGQHFKIVTDCSSFQKTMQKKDLITRIARWALQLEEVDYEIEHRAGSRMKHVDAVS
ncbi:transposon Ty3-I Gag-Pol polyprotein [Trichonephila clavipes]|nr:transposon Ty3-I Gag-Pol polyprotein [Trichonephila clavipes]